MSFFLIQQASVWTEDTLIDCGYEGVNKKEREAYHSNSVINKRPTPEIHSVKYMCFAANPPYIVINDCACAHVSGTAACKKSSRAGLTYKADNSSIHASNLRAVSALSN